MLNKFLILQLLTLLLISCNQKENRTNTNEVTISGKVKKFNGKNADLYLIYSQPGTKEYDEPLKVDSKGNFKFKLKSSIPLDAFILDRKSFANINFIYHPKDSIYLEFNANKKQLDLLKTVVFKGDRHETNNLLIDFQILRNEKKLGYAITEIISFEKKANDFIAEMDSIKTKQLELVEIFKESKSLSFEEEQWINSYALETYYHFLNQYSFENTHLHYNYLKNLNSLKKNNLVSWRILSSNLKSYNRNVLYPDFKNTHNNISNENYSIIDSTLINYCKENIENKLLLQLLLSDSFTSRFRGNIITSYENNQNSITEIINLPILKENLNKYYKEKIEFINKPDIYTNEVLFNMKDTPIEETFSKILSQNKGQVIYMDVWSTWCSPCIQAMPDSKKLMEKFKEEKVSFVYICINSKEDLWKKFVSDFNLGNGQHYLMNRNQSKYFRQTLDVQGIPQYFIIDKKGNIRERGKDIHPQNKITEEKILKYLK